MSESLAAGHVRVEALRRILSDSISGFQRRATMKRPVIRVDGSEDALRALAYALTGLRDVPGAEPHVLNVHGASTTRASSEARHREIP